MKQWRTLGPHSTSEGVMWVMTQSWRSTFWVVQSFRVHILHSRLVTSSNYRCPKLQKKSLGVKSKMSFNPEKFTYWTPKSWRFGMMSFPLKKGMIFSFQPFAPDVGCLSKLKLIWTNFAIFLKEGLFLLFFGSDYLLLKIFGFLCGSVFLLTYFVQVKHGTPWTIAIWNLKTTQWKRENHLNQTSMTLGSKC